VSDDLTSTAGIVALVAGGLAVIALVLLAFLATRMRELRSNQRFILGEGGERDVVAHAQALQRTFDELRAQVDNTFRQLGGRLGDAEKRLNRSISHAAVIRYDAYNEMSGRQSSSIALLDDNGTGVVMSSILHREQARLYVKGVKDGKSEFELSPEEREAIQTALASGSEGEH
jgi:cold shock CspA family protein